MFLSFSIFSLNFCNFVHPQAVLCQRPRAWLRFHMYHFGMIRAWYVRTNVPKMMLQVRKRRENFCSVRACVGRWYLFLKEATKLDGNHRRIRLEGFREALLCDFPRDGSEDDLHIVTCVVLLAKRFTFLKSLGSLPGLHKLSKTRAGSWWCQPAVPVPSDVSCLLLRTYVWVREQHLSGGENLWGWYFGKC